MALLWIATHTESKKKIAAPSQPKLKALMAEAGEWEVKYVDIGKTNKEKLCALYARAKFIEETKEKMTFVVDSEGNVRKKRGSAEKVEAKAEKPVKSTKKFKLGAKKK